MEESIKVTVGNKRISIGKAFNNHINIITNFNLFDYLDLVKMIRCDLAVKEISAVQNWHTDFGGMAIYVNDFFNHKDFAQRIENYLNEIYHEVQELQPLQN